MLGALRDPNPPRKHFRQSPGIGEEYGPDAAQQSLLSP